MCGGQRIGWLVRARLSVNSRIRLRNWRKTVLELFLNDYMERISLLDNLIKSVIPYGAKN